MVGWQAPEVGDGQGNLACCSPWCHKQSDTTERLNGMYNERMLLFQFIPPSTSLAVFTSLFFMSVSVFLTYK